tara:strand:+ start:107 stop:1294 length:1188 start_codon:yes stop_codon:yes gene_type:complete
MNRIISIDVFRALTMVLMIWVNDFWTLKSIPKWLKHAATGEDYLGFSDVIFPWFLFVMGLSIPFAFEDRIKKGESIIVIWKHVILRSIALLVMGLFHMNMEMYNHEISFFTKPIYVIISTSAFFMIWNIYPKAEQKKQNVLKAVRIIGILILVAMFLSFSGKSYDGREIGFETHWWGILGLIGWVYFIAASAALFINNSLVGTFIAFFACLGLNILSSNGIPYNIFSWQSENWIPGSGGLQALTFGGIIVSLFLIKNRKRENIKKLYIILFSFGLASLFLGLFLRDYFIISKIGGTPSWILISLSTAIFLFICLHWIADVKKVLVWYRYIKIAGTATLTCYLIPYYYYSFRTILGIVLPEFFLTGIIGLIKSFIYSFIIVGICWGLRKTKIQLKI